MKTNNNSQLTEAGQRILGSSGHQLQSAFIQLRQKPTATNFSAKALSFYNEDHRDSNSKILVTPGIQNNYATHDQRMSERSEPEANQIGMGETHNRNMRITASGTLTNLIQSIKVTKDQQAMHRPPIKQSKKYNMDLGQNVSYQFSAEEFLNRLTVTF